MFKPLTRYLKDLFGSKIGKVTVSQRLDSTPAVIVSGQYGHSANMERIMRAQTFSDASQLKALAAQRVLEINPRHPLIIELGKAIEESPDEERTQDLAWLLYDTSLMGSGFVQEDMELFTSRMYRTMAGSLNVQSMELVDEIEVELDEEDDEDSETEDLDSVDADHDEF